MTAPAILVAVLAGGGSTRLGRDKALLPWRGGTLLAHVCAAAHGAGLPVMVVGRGAPDVPDDVRVLADESPGEGPLAALVTVLGAHDGAVLLLACDLPRLDAAAVRWLAAMPSGVNGVVLEVAGRLQTCCALYQPSCLPLARACLARGRRSLHALLDAGGFARVGCPEGMAGRFGDVDTQAEWEGLAGQ